MRGMMGVRKRAIGCPRYRDHLSRDDRAALCASDARSAPGSRVIGPPRDLGDRVSSIPTIFIHPIQMLSRLCSADGSHDFECAASIAIAGVSSAEGGDRASPGVSLSLGKWGTVRRFTCPLLAPALGSSSSSRTRHQHAGPLLREREYLRRLSTAARLFPIWTSDCAHQCSTRSLLLWCLEFLFHQCLS